MKANQVALSAMLACAIGALVIAFAEERNVVQQMKPEAVQLRIEGEFPSLSGATEWLNSPPLTAADLHGKVVLIDFWTYSASIGDAHFPMFAHGPRNIRIKDWW